MPKKEKPLADLENLFAFEVLTEEESAVDLTEPVSEEVVVTEIVNNDVTDSLDKVEIIWYKPKYKTSLVKRGDKFSLRPDGSFTWEDPAPLQGLLRELGIEADLPLLETQLWVRGLATTEQVEKLSLARLAELVEDVRKRNKKK